MGCLCGVELGCPKRIGEVAELQILIDVSSQIDQCVVIVAIVRAITIIAGEVLPVISLQNTTRGTSIERR